MDHQPAATTMIVMGVSGAGKTTVARAIAAETGWEFAEGDDFHSPANVEKMRSGHALTDEDRRPWLESIAAWIGEREQAGVSSVVTCSALRRVYREVLRRGHPSVFFVHVDVPADVLAERVARRRGHYMPPSLLRSQLQTLEPLGPDEPGCTISGDVSAEDVSTQAVDAVRRAAGGRPGRS